MNTEKVLEPGLLRFISIKILGTSHEYFKVGENMNPDMRAYMPYHYGTGYMPYPHYGTHMGYGYPSYGMEYYHHHHTHYHPYHHVAFSDFAVPFRYPTSFYHN